MLVIPGLELTFNDPEPVLAAHAVAIGLREFVSVDDGIAEAMRTAAKAGAAIVAAHPNSAQDRRSARAESPVAQPLERRSQRVRSVRERRSGSRAMPGSARSPTASSSSTGRSSSAGSRPPPCRRSRAGDFHTPKHLLGWKTLLPSLHDEGAVVDYLRSPRPVYLARLDAELSRVAA